ncbi:Ribonuclease H [Abeliophyllum distichum]|uniref:Ribonuclease H n=1 Tax=Abeliophyllum distichum TaxID=126358 RepID=A0ABD1QWE9_9LAMI
MEVLSGLRTKIRFWWSVHEEGPTTYQEFLARAEKYISAEEATYDQENDRSDRRDNVKNKEKDLKSEKKENPNKALEFQHPARSYEGKLVRAKLKEVLQIPPLRWTRHRRLPRLERRNRKSHKARSPERVLGTTPWRSWRKSIPGGVKRQRCKLSREAHNSYQVLSGTTANLDAEKFSFSKEDASHVLQPHSDTLVIIMPVSEVNIHRTLLDDGSYVNVQYLRTFKQMDIDARHVSPFSKPLQEFTEDYVNPKGQIVLVVELGLPHYHRRIIADFVIVDLPSNYNAILG